MSYLSYCKLDKEAISKKQHKRVFCALSDFFKRIDPLTKKILEAHVVNINGEWGSYFTMSRYACASPVDEKDHSGAYRLSFNYGAVRSISNAALLGTVAHEFAHVIDGLKVPNWKYRLRKLHQFLLRRSYKDSIGELTADEIAANWGFAKEIKKMRSECNMWENLKVNPSIIKIKQPISDEGMYTLWIRCSKCGAKYTSSYLHFTIPLSEIWVEDQDVLRVHLRVRKNVTEEDFLTIIPCFKCKHSLVVRKKNKETQADHASLLKLIK